MRHNFFSKRKCQMQDQMNIRFEHDTRIQFFYTSRTIISKLSYTYDSPKDQIKPSLVRTRCNLRLICYYSWNQSRPFLPLVYMQDTKKIMSSIHACDTQSPTQALNSDLAHADTHIRFFLKPWTTRETSQATISTSRHKNKPATLSLFILLFDSKSV